MNDLILILPRILASKGKYKFFQPLSLSLSQSLSIYTWSYLYPRAFFLVVGCHNGDPEILVPLGASSPSFDDENGLLGHKHYSGQSSSNKCGQWRRGTSKGLFGCFFFITQFSSLITHHFKISYPFGTITHLSSLNIFHTVCGPHTCH